MNNGLERGTTSLPSMDPLSLENLHRTRTPTLDRGVPHRGGGSDRGGGSVG
jgi:hypothetical protein